MKINKYVDTPTQENISKMSYLNAHKHKLVSEGRKKAIYFRYMGRNQFVFFSFIGITLKVR